MVEDLVNAADLLKLKKNLKEIFKEFQSVAIKYMKNKPCIFLEYEGPHGQKRKKIREMIMEKE